MALKAGSTRYRRRSTTLDCRPARPAWHAASSRSRTRCAPARRPAASCARSDEIGAGRWPRSRIWWSVDGRHRAGRARHRLRGIGTRTLAANVATGVVRGSHRCRRADPRVPGAPATTWSARAGLGSRSLRGTARQTIDGGGRDARRRRGDIRRSGSAAFTSSRSSGWRPPCAARPSPAMAGSSRSWRRTRRRRYVTGSSTPGSTFASGTTVPPTGSSDGSAACASLARLWSMLRCTDFAISRPARRASLIRRSNSVIVHGFFGRRCPTPARRRQKEPLHP